MPVAQAVDSRKTENTQMNTRISVELKSQGDAVFARLGLSSSQAVRKFYEFAASCAAEPEKLERAIMDEREKEQNADERQRRIAERLKLVERGANLFKDALVQMGIDESSDDFVEFINQPYDDLREAALLEKHGWEEVGQ